MSRAVWIGLLVLSLGITSVSAGSGTPDPAAREWNQHRGNWRRDSAVDVAPIRAEPKVAWERKLDGKLVSGIVSWGDSIYFVTKNGSRRKLLAIHAASGAVQATKSLPKGHEVDIAVWQGMVIIRESGLLSSHAHRGKRISGGWKKRANWTGRPLVHAGRILLSDDKNFHVLSTKNGKSLASSWRLNGVLALGFIGGRCHVAGVTVSEGEDDSRATASVQLMRIIGLTDKKPQFDPPAAHAAGALAQSLDRVRVADCAVLRIGRNPAGWVLFSPARFRGEIGTQRGATVPDRNPEDGGLCMIETVPAVHEGLLFGFDGEGTLTAVNSSGKFVPIVSRSDLPKGARPGPAVACRGAIVFGNWALDTKSSRVLWSLPDLKPTGQAIPAADGVLVVPVEGGKILGLVDPLRVAAKKDAGATAESKVRPTAPTEENLVVFRDGRRVKGKAERLADGKYRCGPAGEKAVTADPKDLLLVVVDGKIVHKGDPFEIYGLFRDALDADLVDAFEPIFLSYQKAGLLTDCRRLMLLAEEHGLTGARREDWNRRLTGRAERKVDQIRKNIAKREEKIRPELWQRCVEAAAWCRERGLPGAASVLLGDADRIHPGKSEIETLAKALIPVGFPWKDRADPGRRWIAWAAKILPAGAEFLPTGDPAWKRASNAPWNSDTIGFRTPNLLLFSRSEDIEAVSRCLRSGEATVRVLDVLLCEGKGAQVENDWDRLEVRIHRNRKEFMAENPGDTEHLAGYYSPGEGISRFFVPRDQGSGELLGRSLFQVLSHELTHQYIEERWLADQFPEEGTTPGYWIVEGLARFVEDQSLEMGRRGLRFDDETVSSLDCSARVLKKGKLFPLRRLLGLTHLDFSRLDHRPAITVQLRNTLATYQLSEVHLFYEQAGSLVFYLMLRAGPDAKKALIQYARDHYGGRLNRTSGRILGFPDVSALEKGYRKFLEGL